mmetsp:Transcript_1670/g.4557  ORF Transcript_1670/g.4557 Transcript_1670/m.4557 type:complete len:206 (-) Transcript_1670:149-766(-)
MLNSSTTLAMASFSFRKEGAMRALSDWPNSRASMSRKRSTSSLFWMRSSLVSTFTWGSSSCTMALKAVMLPAMNLAASVMNWASSMYTAHTFHPSPRRKSTKARKDARCEYSSICPGQSNTTYSSSAKFSSSTASQSGMCSSRNSMAYTRAPLGPRPVASMMSSTVTSCRMSRAASYWKVSAAGSMLTMCTERPTVRQCSCSWAQ